MKNHTMHYRHLLIMLILSFVGMYFLMYAMADSLGNVFMNVNQAYMAALMAAPMALIELVVMRSMYPDRRLNTIVVVASVAVAMMSWTAIRNQTGVNDSQFLRSMIPHHAGAILMCEQAAIENPAVTHLCTEIIASQRREIETMKTLLRTQ